MKGFDLRKSPPLGAILAAERAPVRRDTGEGAAAFLAANLSRPTGSFGQPPKGESGTFYFAQIRNFLLCLDTRSFLQQLTKKALPLIDESPHDLQGSRFLELDLVDLPAVE